MQSAGLSLLSPSLAVFNSAGNTILAQQVSSNLGDTVTVAIPNVSAGQVYDIRCQGSTTGNPGFGSYGLQVNFGSLTQAPIPPPNTTVPQGPDKGGGTLNESGNGNAASNPGSAGQVITVGTVTGIGDPMMINEMPIANWTWELPKTLALESRVADVPSDHRFPTCFRNRSSQPERDNDTGFLL